MNKLKHFLFLLFFALAVFSSFHVLAEEEKKEEGYLDLCDLIPEDDEEGNKNPCKRMVEKEECDKGVCRTVARIQHEGISSDPPTGFAQAEVIKVEGEVNAE